MEYKAKYRWKYYDRETNLFIYKPLVSEENRTWLCSTNFAPLVFNPFMLTAPIEMDLIVEIAPNSNFYGFRLIRIVDYKVGEHTSENDIPPAWVVDYARKNNLNITSLLLDPCPLVRNITQDYLETIRREL